MKLALGTVQFGLDYGVSNSAGQVEKSQVADILAQANYLGIDTLDCAGAYGNSEQVLGELLTTSSNKQPFNIVSKIPTLKDHESSISEYFTKTLNNLHCSHIESLLFHHADNLIFHPKKDQLFQQLQALKSQQKINNIGASLYSPEQLFSIGEQYDLDLVQVPLNLFDQRFISSKVLSFCQQKQIKMHVRSLFLQGLLLMAANKVPNYFSPYQDKLNAFTTLGEYLGCSKLTLALAIVAQELPNSSISNASNIIEKIVVGVCSVKQLTEIVTAFEQAKALAISFDELSALADHRLELINPSLWVL